MVFDRNQPGKPERSRERVFERPAPTHELLSWLEMQREVTAILCLELATPVACQKIIESICHRLDWGQAAVWLEDAHGQLFCCASQLCLLPDPVKNSRTNHTGESKLEQKSPERVKSSGQIETLEGQEIALPIFSGLHFLGVMQLIDAKIINLPQLLIETLQSIAGQVGQYLFNSRLKAALLESDERYSLAVDGAMDGIWDMNMKTNEVYFSRPFIETLGYQPNELPGTVETFFDLCHPDDAGLVSRAVRRHLLRHTAFASVQFRLRKKDGDYLWFSGRGKGQWNELGQAIRFAGSNREISEQKRAEELLRQSEEHLSESRDQFDQLAENIHDIFWIWQPHLSHFSFISRAFEKITGRSVQSVYDDPEGFLKAVYDEDRPIAINSMKHILIHKTIAEGEYRIMRADGSAVWMQARSFPVLDEKGALVSVCGIAHDISAGKEAERRVSEFYSTVSHELRTPLTSVRAALGLMEGGVVKLDSGEAMQLVKIARESADRLIRLINDILDWKKIELGKMEYQATEISPQVLVSAVVSEISATAEKAGIKLVSDVRLHCPVVADYDRIFQVIINLVSNAIKFSPHGSQVTILVETAGGGAARFSIVDNGPGIAERDQARLFVRFQQLDSSDTRKQGGTGLGLSISKAIVEQQGGKIGVDSVVGRGSTFWIELPYQPDISCESS